jgi:predicted protein tyrosine phosphatase
MKLPPFSVLTVCGLDELKHHSTRGVTHVLSILDPDWPEPESFEAFDRHMRATLYFHDAIEPAPGIVLPQETDVETILAFGRNLGDDLRHLLIHCHAGISRSTAAMAMVLAQAFPNENEDAIVDRIVADQTAGMAKLTDGLRLKALVALGTDTRHASCAITHETGRMFQAFNSPPASDSNADTTACRVNCHVAVWIISLQQILGGGGCCAMTRADAKSLVSIMA